MNPSKNLTTSQINQTENEVKSFSILDDRTGMWKWLIITGATAILIPLTIFLVNSLVLTKYNPTAFQIFGNGVAWYGIFIFIGFLSAILIGCVKLWKLYKIPIDPFYWFCLMGIPTAILGARIWSYIIGDASEGDPSWSHFFDFKEGGLAVEGGVILTILLACWWFPFILKYPKYQVRDFSTQPNKVRQVSFLAYVDAIVPAILIGQIIGRYGNYQNQELYGKIIKDNSYANIVQHLFPLMNINGFIYQPLFFYESCINWIGLILIFFVGELIPKKKLGDLGFAYFLWYGILRLCLEGLREPRFAFATTYIMSSIWVFIAIALIILNHTLFTRIRKYSFKSTIKNKKISLKTDDQMLYYLGR